MNAFPSNSDNLILLDNFNVEPTEKHMKDFSLIYNCKNIIRDKTCYKNPAENPKCIDLIMTNTSKSFQNSQAIETGLSDFHKMCLTVLKVFYPKQKPLLFNIEVLRYFQMKLLFLISKIRFFNSALVGKTILLKNSKVTVDVILKKHALLKKDILEQTRLPSLIKL